MTPTPYEHWRRAVIVPRDTGVPGGATGIHMGGVPPMALVGAKRAGPSVRRSSEICERVKKTARAVWKRLHSLTF